MADNRDVRIAQLEAEVAQRDRVLAEALEQQTAMAEILRVIASAPMELERIMQAVAHSAMHSSHSTACVLSLREGDTHRIVATAGDFPSEQPPRVGEARP